MDRNMVGDALYHAEGVPALLDDYANIIDALVAAYEATGDTGHLDRARGLMEQCLDAFWDGAGGGFFDTAEAVIGMRLKGIDDSPHPSANAVLITALLNLAFILDKPAYRERAEAALKAFAGQGEAMGIHSGYYFAALDAFFNMAELTVSAPPDSALAGAARSAFHPHAVIAYRTDGGQVTACIGATCFEPQRDGEGLRRIMQEALKAPRT
jgi:uncharacterized protein YyaL (SSP411 family)